MPSGIPIVGDLLGANQADAAAAAGAQMAGYGEKAVWAASELSKQKRDEIDKWREDVLSQLKQAAEQGLVDLDTAASAATSIINANYDQAYSLMQQTYAPFAGAGTNLANLINDPSTFQQDAGYNFLRQQGEQGVLRNASALGGLQSGATIKGLSEFNQGLASTALNDRISQLASLAQMQQTGASNMANIKTNQGNILADIQGNLGTNKATLRNTGAQNYGNAATNFLNQWLSAMPDEIPSLLGGIGTSQAQSLIGQANAKAQGTSNLLNLGTQLLGLNALGAFGSGTQSTAGLGTGATGNIGASTNLVSMFK